jgi:DNA-binding transcriptional ArsR family regulator
LVYQTKYRARRRGDGDGELSKDVVFSILSNGRRRFVIRLLKRADGPVAVRDLAQQVAAWENGVSVPELTYKQRKRAYTSLHQTHLPKLKEAGIVEYDSDRGTVSTGDAVAAVDSYLGPVPTDGAPWSVRYLGLAGFSLLAVALAWVGVSPFAQLPDLVLAGAIALLFAVAAGVQTYSVRGSRTESTTTEDRSTPVASSPPTALGDGDD